jgi:hypothetical protein
MGFRAPGLLRIPQWSIVNRLVTAQDVSYDINGVETGRIRTDLTGGVVHLTVRDANGTIVIQKDSTNIAEIELKDQVSLTTRGQAVIKFVESDTAPLLSTAQYTFDIWAATSDGREEPIVDRGRFVVDASVTHISAGPAPNLPTFPASQTPQERSFRFVAPGAGSAFTVAIPAPGMVDNSYTVHATLNTIVGALPVIACPDAGRTTTQLDLATSIPLAIGDTIDFLLRDRA